MYLSTKRLICSAATTLVHLSHKHLDWFDENNDEIQRLFEVKHRLHKAHQDDTSSVSKKAAYSNFIKTVRAILSDMQDSWLRKNTEEIHFFTGELTMQYSVGIMFLLKRRMFKSSRKWCNQNQCAALGTIRENPSPKLQRKYKVLREQSHFPNRKAPIKVHKKVQVGKVQEKAQTQKDSHSRDLHRRAAYSICESWILIHQDVYRDLFVCS